MSVEASLAGLVAILGSSYQMTNSFIPGWAIRDVLDEGSPDLADQADAAAGGRAKRLRAWVGKNSVLVAAFAFAITGAATIALPSPWYAGALLCMVLISLGFIGVLLGWPHLIFTVESVREPTDRQLVVIRQQAPNAAGWMLVVVAGMLSVMSTAGGAEWPAYGSLVAMFLGMSFSFLANRKVREDRAAAERAEVAAQSLPPLPSEKTRAPGRRRGLRRLLRASLRAGDLDAE